MRLSITAGELGMSAVMMALFSHPTGAQISAEADRLDVETRAGPVSKRQQSTNRNEDMLLRMVIWIIASIWNRLVNFVRRLKPP